MTIFQTFCYQRNLLERVRYMMPRLHWMIEKVNQQHIKLIYKNTQELPADLGTKLHQPGDHRRKSIRVMGDQLAR